MKKIISILFAALFFFASEVTFGQCTASFSFNQSGDTLVFTDNSVAPADSIVSWSWSFGNGGSDSTQNPTIVYAACGSYVVSLDIFTAQGCSSTFEDTIAVSGSANVNLSVQIDTTTGNVTITATPNHPDFFYNWGFSDGGTGVGSTVTNNFPNGSQWACTIFSDNSGACATDTFCTFFNVNSNAPACQAAFNYSTNGTSVSFTNTSTAPGDSITGYQWAFGNFQTSTLVNPTTTYASCGYYIVQLTMYTQSGCSNMVFDTITVPGQINGNFTYTIDTLTGIVQFFGSPNNSTYSFSWDFGDGNFGGGANPSNTYVDGTYTACMIVSQANSACSADTVCNTFIVSVDSLSCPVSWDNTNTGTVQVFTANPLNFNDTYNWDFGDGNTGTGAIANNTYTAPGTYTVCMDYVSADNGCTAQFCDTVIVSSAGCSMQISYVNNGAGNYTFTANVTNGGIFPVVAWIFGDGGTGFGLNPTHQYTANGFNIVCAVLNPPPIPGCSDTVCTFVIVSGVVGIQEVEFLHSLSVAPNPFSEEIAIDFTLDSDSDVEIDLFDIMGNQVETVANEKRAQGKQQFKHSTSKLAAGVYYLKVKAGNDEVCRKLIKY
jgi:PKD repeat protein